MDRASQDREILDDRPVVDVVEVEADGVLPREVAPTRDLPEAGQPGRTWSRRWTSVS